PRGVKEEILGAQNEFNDTDRALDLLLVALKDNEPSIRSLSAFYFGERALVNASLTPDALESLRQLVVDPDTTVREEVGHALGKIGIGYAEFSAKCLESLNLLQTDAVAIVSDRAKRSI